MDSENEVTEVMPQLDIFISSKMLELKAERDALYELLPTLDYGDIRFHAWIFEEDAVASNQSIRDVYLKALQNSALYLGLFWREYGEWTIDEFDRATDWGMERHIYVKDVDVEADKRDIHLKKFLDKWGDVPSGITAKWFRSIDQLCEAVKHTLDTWVQAYRSGPAGEASARVYSTLSDVLERPETLIGRDDLVERVENLLNQNERVLLQGFSGIGKTSIAAEICAKRTPALWLRIGRSDADVIFQALATPFDAQEDMAKKSGANKAHLLRSLLTQAQIQLVILDDAWNGQALLSAIKGIPPHIPLLVTSRRQYGLSQIVEVGNLLPEKAVELLSYHAGQTFGGNATASALCAMLGYLPFAIRIAGINLKTRKWLPADLQRRIENTAHKMSVPLEFSESGRENVAALLQVSVNALDKEALTLLRAFGAFFAPQLLGGLLSLYWVLFKEEEVDPEELASIISMIGRAFPFPGPSVIEPNLDTLIIHGLVERILADIDILSSYRIHELTFSYLKAQATEDQRRRALSTCVAYTEYFNDEPNKTNFMFLQPVVPQMLEAATWALSMGHYREIHRFTANLFGGSAILHYQGFYDATTRLLQIAVQAANREEDLLKQALYLYSLGITHNELEMYRLAIDCFNEAIALAIQIRNLDLGEHIFTGLGGAYAGLGLHEDAMNYYKQGLILNRETGRRDNKSALLSHLGTLSIRLQNHEQAIGYFEESLLICREIGEAVGEAANLNGLGIAYTALGKLQKATECCLQALAIDREIDYKLGEGKTLISLGDVNISAGDYQQAINSYERASTVFLELKMPNEIAWLDKRIAEVQSLLDVTRESKDDKP